ncbi:MAG: LysM peptidoglycan-binding domain-containing protein, partial [Geminicoccaceae bacterium]
MLVLVLLCSAPGARADEVLSVRVEEGQNLRDIAKQYLGDPDLWTAILRANDLHSVTEVKAGTELEIPVTRIAKANSALADSLEAIQKATQEGARLFAADEIATAIQLHDEALAARKEARWEDSARLADQAGVSAEEALKVALADRDAKAEARLSDRQGWVEGQRPQDLVWDERPINA